MGRGQRAGVLSNAVIGTVVFPHMLFAPKRATLRGPESEDRDSNALTTKSRQSTMSNFSSSIKVLAMKLDLVPPSKNTACKLDESSGSHDPYACCLQVGEVRGRDVYLADGSRCSLSSECSSGSCLVSY